MSAYTEASRAVFEVFDDTSPLVEGISIDEAFLDVRGHGADRGHAAEIAVRLRREVLERVGLPITVGVARTKFLAKVASGVAKPDGLLVVPPGGELALPAPAAGRAAVGRRARSPPTSCTRRGITTVGQVARLAETALVAMLGRGGGPPAARPGPQPRSAARCRSAAGAARWARSARSAARRRVARRAGRRRSSGWSTASRGGCARPRRVCRTVVLRLRFDDFSRATRSHTLPDADRARPSRSSPPRGRCCRRPCR